MRKSTNWFVAVFVVVCSNLLWAGDVGKMWAEKVGVDKKVVLWSSRPEYYTWMQISKTIDDMVKDKSSAPVNIIAARNEYETRQFIITPSPEIADRVGQVTFSISEFTGPGGAKIGKDDILIEWLRYAYHVMTRPPNYKRFDPDLLIPTNIAWPDRQDCYGSVNEPTNIVFWVTVYVPKSTPAGVYRAQVTATVNVGGKEVKLKRDIELTVLDVTLPHMTHTRTALFTSKFSEWIVRDLARFRISFGKLPDSPEGLIKYGRLMHKLGVQITFVGPWLDMYDALGLTPSYRKGKPPKQALEDCRKYYQWAYPILKREGWLKEAYARLPDEFRKMEIAKKVVWYVKLLRKWAPGLKVQATNSNNFPEDVGNFLKDYVDIWCPIDYQRKFYQDRVKEGDELWPYVHGPAYLGAKSEHRRSRRFYLWRLWTYHATGICYWCVGPRGKFIWTPYGMIRRDETYPGDGTLYYPQLKPGEVKGVVGGIGKEAGKPPYWHSARLTHLRDGIEDREYLWLIDKLSKELGGKLENYPEIKSLIEEKDRILKEVSGNIWKVDVEKVDLARTKFARLIKLLKEVSR